MSRTANMSIMALYGWDNTLFDLLTLPTGLTKADLINNICSQLAELELLYPNPDVMKTLIGVWSNACQYEWNKLYNTMNLAYNPIDNYDRTETRNLSSQGSGNSADGGADTFAGNGTGKVAGFNSQNIVTRDENVNSSTSTYGKTNQESFQKTDTETINSHGNIGVTTTQQMIEQERNIAKFNLYDTITEEFKQRFCILVY